MGDKSNIVFSANNREEVMILPVVPEIEVEKPQNNEQFETINNGTLNLIGDEGLRTFSITSIFPSQKYIWLKSGSVAEPFKYVDFFNKWRAKKVPLRIVTSRPDGREWFNMACLIDNFTFKVRRNGDIAYTLDVSEYPFVEGV
ncbi:hypothetical protein [Anaerosalibacter sp. Marseille-P3206]|uniref:hypothetical protein n=1 Tax=Anaerosalibacter sp. Marseille-P3206 TaxID=1871005 RepID=UPI000985AFE5|nr:hypothetical protein [Anaerosalibacter sp. Marseille-P3206]